MPGYPEENSRVRMACLKRYSDFKNLRTALLTVLEMQQRAAARNSVGGGTFPMALLAF